MKIEKNVKGNILIVKVILPQKLKGSSPQKITTSNIINLPELEKYGILSVITQDVILSSEESEVIGEWTFELRKQPKPKKVSRKMAEEME